VKRRILLLSLPLCIALTVLVLIYWNEDQPAPHVGMDRRPTPPRVPFTDITREAGIHFVHDIGRDEIAAYPEENGPGCGFFDFDNDGDQDLCLVDSGKWLHRSRYPEEPTVTHSLYENNGDGHFRDIGANVGLQCRGYGLGVCFGDIDNDGFEDVYVTGVGPNALFWNDQGRRFVDIASEAGVDCDVWSSVAAFVDYDRDGLLDLFVGNYVVWSLEIERGLIAEAGSNVREWRRDPAQYAPAYREAYDRLERLVKEERLSPEAIYAHAPDLYAGTHCRLYRNLGGRKFEDVSERAGMFRKEKGWTPATRCMGVAVADYDGDGWPDIAVANDSGADFLFRNLGGRAFRDVALEAGLAMGNDGEARDCMGMQWVDYRNVGRLSLCVGRYARQEVALFVPRGGTRTVFLDAANLEGLWDVPLEYTNWGQFFFDYDLDGRQDFFLANGHVNREWARFYDQSYEQEQCLFWNTGTEPAFRRVGPEHAGPDLPGEKVGRGAAYGDIDGDGDLDVLLTTNGGAAHLFRNDLGPDRRFIRLELTGTESNRSAIGATVRLRTGRIWQRRDVTSGSSYASQSELPLTFGLGTHERADEIEIRWPSGLKQSFRNVPANRTIRLVEGKEPTPSLRVQ